MSHTPHAAPRKATRRIFLTFIGVAAVMAVVTAVVVALLVNIFEHKVESKNPFFRVVELDDNTVDPAVWGKNFPMQYDGYTKTVDMQRTRFGGSEAVPRTPTDADPRSVVAQSKLEEDPRLKTMWAGYAFSKDFREERGHAYMLEDQSFTERQSVPQPGACLNCHGSTYSIYKELGKGDIFAGFDALNHMPYADARKLAAHPVACIDCHDPTTMALRITRPAFITGIKEAKAAQGIANYDVNTMATRQEMRAFVCGQCHVEYYFKGEGKTLTYPWSKGLKADEILSYYQETDHKDWVHEDSGEPALKAQHPEFEMWNQGVHARSGVSCADCHMPYTRVGALKISDHHIQSPLLNVNHACQTCHKFSEDELKSRVELIQSRTLEMRNRAMDALVEFIGQIKAAKDAGATPESLAPAQDAQRQAQFLIDFIEAENSSGFHAPQEAARILMEALDIIRKAQLTLVGPAAPLQTAEVAPASAQ